MIINTFITFVLLIYIFTLVDAQQRQPGQRCEEYCYSTDGEKPQSIHFATKSAYQLIKGNSTEQFVVPNCNPVKLWFLVRHGTRLPIVDDIPDLRELEALRDETIDNYEKKGTKPDFGGLCDEDLELIRSWQWNSNITTDSSLLMASEGRQEMLTLAENYHMAILNKVCRTFLKTIAPYLIIISAFGMSFFALNYDDYNEMNGDDSDEDKGFSNPFLSTISTVRMMLSDFGAVTIKKGDHFQGILFLAFMISISIVLFNLLNALAISDTNEMMEVAEFVEIKKRISTLRSYETLYSFFKVTYANVFPKLTTIMLTPNKHSAIKVKKRVQMLDNVTILMQKTGKISNFEYLYADWMLWKSRSQPLTFDEKLINKILNFVKDQQQKDLRDMDKISNNQELYAIRVAQEDIYKELLKISNQQNSIKTIEQDGN